MTTEEISAKVYAIIADKLGVEPSEITNEASFTNDLIAMKENMLSKALRMLNNLRHNE